MGRCIIPTDPPPNAVKSFATAQVLELAGELAILNKMRNEVYEFWRRKNANRGNGESKHNGQH